MLKERIKYTDYDGNEREEDFYFNLTETECTEMAWSVNGGLQAFIQRIIDEKDQTKIVAYFKEFLLKAYGEKSLDGKRFVKSEEISKAFSETEAYNILFMRLGSDAEYAAKFVEGVLPKRKQPEDHKEPQA
jgi:hypothetical protein